MKSTSINLPYVVQGKRSANCGPCSIKMIADYYGLKRSTGSGYSLPSLNRLCRVSTEWGCEKSDINRVFRRIGLKRERVKLSNLQKYISKGWPVITLLIDESGQGHYAVIKGVDGDRVIFNDSYWGEDFSRSKSSLSKQIHPFGNWLWAVVQN